MPSTRLGVVLLLALVTGVACTGPGAAPTPSPTTTATASVPPTVGPTTTASAAPTPAGQTPGSTIAPTITPATSASATPAGAAFGQPWAVAPLIDVTTGEQFRIADLAAAGKVVFVETMAIWCTNCRAQQRAATEAFAQLDPSRVEWVGIDVETSETAEALVRYRDQNGFPFRYAISDTGLSRALADDFGDIVLSPPSVNLIILGTDGEVTHLTGHHSAAEIVSLAQEHGA